MSLTTSMRFGGSDSVEPYAGRVWRVVEAQHLISTRPLAEDDAGQMLLEQMIDSAKPPPREPEGAQPLHYLLATPFRYRPPLRAGSRFGSSRERALWYGAEHVDTALAEKAYHLLRWVRGTDIDAFPFRAEWADFSTRVATERCVDLTAEGWDGVREEMESATSYAATQALGGEMRGAGVEAVRYRSVRDPGRRANLGLFTPRAFAQRSPDLARSRVWLVLADAASVRVARKRPFALGESYHFPEAGFRVDGDWPDPR